MRAVCLILILLASTCIAAEEPGGPDLPPTDQVYAALARNPAILGARSGIRMEQANRDRLVAGDYEFQVRGTVQNRNVAPSEQIGATSSTNFTEWDFAIERPIRLPGKARMDRDIGAQGVTVAQRTATGAWHETARGLLRLWFAWMREGVQLELWQQQAQFMRAQHAIVGKRVAAGDAPKLEANLAEAAIAQAEATVAQFQGRVNAARQAIEQSFPELKISGPPPPHDPLPIGESVDFYLQRSLKYNDELTIARAESRRRELLAQRSSAQGTPDPTVGFRIASEFGGAERVAGVYISIPLPGAARAATRDGAWVQLEIAHEQEATVERRIRSDIASLHAAADGAYRTWLRARSAAEGMSRNALLVARAYELREATLAELVNARKLAVDTELNSALARLEAAEIHYRMQIDAHLLWPDPQDVHED